MRHPVTIVFLIAFFVRIGYAILIQFLHPNSIYLFDSWGYLNIAYNLFHDGIYSQMSQSPQTPDSTRTPFYPIYIYAFHLLQLHGEWLVYVQALIGAATAATVTNCALLIKRNRLAAFFAGLLVALDIPSIFFSNTVLTETWFTFFITLTVFYLIKSIKFYEPKNRIWVLTFLICAVYTKPIALYLLIAIPIIFLLFNQHGLKYELKQSIKFLSLAVLFISPWVYRNHVTFGAPFYSSISEINFLFHTTANIKATVNNTTRHEEEYQYRNNPPLSELNFEHNAKVIPLFRAFAQKECMETIKENPKVAANIFFKSWVGFFIKPLRSYLSMQLNGKKLGSDKPLTMAANSSSYSSSFMHFMKKGNKIELIAVLIQLLFLIVIYLSITAALPIWLNIDRRVFVLLVCLVLYFSLASSITDLDARFRVPVLPILALLGHPFFSKMLKNYAHE